MDELIEEIFAKHTTYPPIDDSRVVEFETKVGYALPVDLKRFYARCDGARLFEREGDFTYEILPLEEVKRTRVYVFGEDSDDDNWAPGSWYAICDVMDGNYVGMDLASIASDGATCSIIDCFHETHGVPGNNLIIAKSFTEFLRRALHGGENLYWLQPGFEGYGDALKAEAK